MPSNKNDSYLELILYKVTYENGTHAHVAASHFDRIDIAERIVGIERVDVVTVVLGDE